LRWITRGIHRHSNLQKNRGADENLLAVDHGTRLSGSSGMIAGQIADDNIDINGEHARFGPR
jgi:hypothetical protein